MDLKEKVFGCKNRHPWEMSRFKMIFSIVKNDVIQHCNSRYVDFGAGDLYFSNEFSNKINGKVFCVDKYFTDFRDENTKIIKLSESAGIVSDSIDIVFLLDVLEHVESEKEIIDEIYRLLKKQGKLIVTVPAFQFLYCEHDKFLGHKKRYLLNELTELFLVDDKFEIEGKFYFYFSLFCFRYLCLLMSKICKIKLGFQGINDWKYSENSAITRIVVKFLNLDFSICKLFAKFNIFIKGLSICVILKKR